MVRITVNTPEAARAVPFIREQLDRINIAPCLWWDFHYNGHPAAQYGLRAGLVQVPDQSGQCRQRAASVTYLLR